jgi:hypothetical protein
LEHFKEALRDEEESTLLVELERIATPPPPTQSNGVAISQFSLFVSTCRLLLLFSEKIISYKFSRGVFILCSFVFLYLSIFVYDGNDESFRERERFLSLKMVLVISGDEGRKRCVWFLVFGFRLADKKRKRP